MTLRLILMCAKALTLDWPTRWADYWRTQAAGYALRAESYWLAYMPLLLAKCPHTPRTYVSAGQPLACLRCSGPDNVPGLHGLRIRSLYWLARVCARLGGAQLVDNRSERGEARLSTAWMLLLACVLGTLAWIVIWAVIAAAITHPSTHAV